MKLTHNLPSGHGLKKKKGGGALQSRSFMVQNRSHRSPVLKAARTADVISAS